MPPREPEEHSRSSQMKHTYYVLPDEIVLSLGIELSVVGQIVVSFRQQLGFGPG